MLEISTNIFLLFLLHGAASILISSHQNVEFNVFQSVKTVDLSSSQEKGLKPEVLVFLLNCSENVWKRMDWQKITTVVVVGWLDVDFVNFAHAHKALVSYIPPTLSKAELENSTARDEWVSAQIKYIQENNLDGVNFDFEEDVEEGSAASLGYTKLVKETGEKLRQLKRKTQLSIDFAWSPGADGRLYQYKELADAADLVFIMAYDTQSQMWEKRRCRAKANSPLVKIFRGVQKYQQLGILLNKTILGVPWYGYKYPCTSWKEASNICYIEEVPFRGCNCSDAAGSEIAYSEIQKILTGTGAIRNWDVVSKTPYFTVPTETGERIQYWFDDPESLSIKYKIGLGMGMAGVGFWTGNFLDYNNQTMVQSMWNILP